MTQIHRFPFGQPLVPVKQKDRNPKRLFVLGVYASAVHARWVGSNGESKVNALAVASEPYIFWRGEGAEEIISNITIPAEVGKLLPAAPQFNGPSGKALDDQFLTPLGFDRNDAWLCDLVPHSCANLSQREAIDREYSPLIEKYGLPMPSVPVVPTKLSDEARREAILDEIRESQAHTLILLGDQPIKWFLSYFDKQWIRLSDLGIKPESYGRLHPIKLDGQELDILPLAHPRQVAKLGQSSRSWFTLHQEWIKSVKKLLVNDGTAEK